MRDCLPDTPEIVTNGQVPHLSGVQEDVGMETAGMTRLGFTMLMTEGMLMSAAVLSSVAVEDTELRGETQGNNVGTFHCKDEVGAEYK